MIDKQYGKFSLVCDNCGDGEEEFKTFDDVQEYIKDNDWKQTNRICDNHKINYCPMCGRKLEVRNEND